MHVDQTEKQWLYISVLVTVMMVALLTFYAVASNIHPPSNVEIINSDTLHLPGSEFEESNLGVKHMPDGSVEVRMVAARYGFYPQRIEVPVHTPVRFRIASADVLHGIHVPFTNLNTMVVPGFVSEVNTVLQKTGEAPMFCNEYCGLGHDQMWSRLVVVEKDGDKQ